MTSFPTRLIRLPKRRPQHRDITAPRRPDTRFITIYRADESLSVESNAIAHMEYDRDAQELTFTFARDGSRYVIAGISEIEAYRWANSDSPGKYFNSFIRGKY